GHRGARRHGRDRHRRPRVHNPAERVERLRRAGPARARPVPGHRQARRAGRDRPPGGRGQALPRRPHQAARRGRPRRRRAAVRSRRRRRTRQPM
ncbi:MAG: hypothetical protein AVDCRST_MAG64-635, partial [uncultured Phycisphaerae bacterium]